MNSLQNNFVIRLIARFLVWWALFSLVLLIVRVHTALPVAVFALGWSVISLLGEKLLSKKK
ncbi:MAG: hypothetical protein BGO01_12690 [Armatimonadetes bacterium 55-13]|nr:hypothetical protein [Armatimonadota bacterium]OJU61769.1 MAG: hypothetical protein BGO01_12690 [Armatimonadetes bacterium 55-13]